MKPFTLKAAAAMVREDTFVRAEIRRSRQGWLVMIAVSDLLPSLLDALIFDEDDNTTAVPWWAFRPMSAP